MAKKNNKQVKEITQKEGIVIIIESVLFAILQCFVIYFCLDFAKNNGDKINKEFIGDVLFYVGILFCIAAIMYNTGKLIVQKNKNK